ncbi:MAG: NAD-dependent epimerase/dehydratase family protein [Acidobacteria bacterium]|nr:NAD-dependent epimerase/dehydratase family protein [Acidobacteriota bacterium]
MDLLILGCGFTGIRVARRFIARGVRVMATTRHPDKLPSLPVRAVHLDVADRASLEGLDAPGGALVLHSIPVVDGDLGLLPYLGSRPSRVVYLSTTSVYGRTEDVDEHTPVAPRTERARRRVETERAIVAGPWSSLILRPAAIYGPGRGVHVSMRAGNYRLKGGGENWISRIHVEDLAALAEAALLSDLTGAYPVADDEPCTARRIAGYCAELLGLPLPPSIVGTPSSNRRVRGGAIRRLLGVSLRFPSYTAGIPAAIAEEESCLPSCC